MEICIQRKIDLVEMKIAEWKIITVIRVTCVQKNSQIQTLIQHLVAKYQFFKKTNCFYSMNFMAVAWEEYFLSILPVVIR